MKEKEKERFENSRKAVLLKIVERRKELGIPQADLALMLNMSFSGYFKVETGKIKLDTQRMFEILFKLKTSPKEFFKDIK